MAQTEDAEREVAPRGIDERIASLIEKTRMVQTSGRLDAETEIEDLRDVLLSTLEVLREMHEEMRDVESELGDLEERYVELFEDVEERHPFEY